MKTRSLLVLGVLALALLFAGCSSDGGEDYSISLVGPESLSAYGGSEGTPQTNTEAKTSAANVDSAMSTSIDSLQSAIASSIAASATQSENFNQTIPGPQGGQIVFTGNGTYTYPDSQGNGTYSIRMNYNADVNNVSIDPDSSGSPFTVVDGQMAANFLVSWTLQQNSDGSGSVTVEVVGQYGWALSVSSNDSSIKSGKYVLLVNMGGGGTVSWDSSGNYSTTDLTNSVSISGNLKVYNNSNQLIRETTLTASDLATDESLFTF